MVTRYRYDPRADSPMAPGVHIREILEDRGITQSDFAVRMGKTEKFVSQLINGKATLSRETALELERVLGVPSSFWNNGESIYRDVLARIRREEESAEQAKWAKSFPLKEMASNGWVARESTPAEQAEELLSFFGVSSIDAYRQYWGAEKRLAARMSNAYSAETPAIAAWLRAGEREAERIPTEPYGEAEFREVLAWARSATRRSPDEWFPMLVSKCASAGVALVLIRDLPKTRCHAVSWWPHRTKAVIQLGLRGKSDDQFWFSFFREAGHVLLDRSRSGINGLNKDSAAEERANAFAADFLIPHADYAEFARAGRPSKAKVIAFAEAVDIAPSIVVGRLQRDMIIPGDWMNDLKTKVDWAE